MTLVLDSGGLSALAGHRARLAELRRRKLWPPVVPAVVLTESLTGDHRRDFHANKVLSLCAVVDATEDLAREAASLRTRALARAHPSAVDALVAATAVRRPGSTVLTSDPDDLSALLADEDVTVMGA